MTVAQFKSTRSKEMIFLDCGTAVGGLPSGQADCRQFLFVQGRRRRGNSSHGNLVKQRGTVKRWCVCNLGCMPSLDEPKGRPEKAHPSGHHHLWLYAALLRTRCITLQEGRDPGVERYFGAEMGTELISRRSLS